MILKLYSLILHIDDEDVHVVVHIVVIYVARSLMTTMVMLPHGGGPCLCLL